MKFFEKRPRLLFVLLTLLVFFPTFFNDFQLAWDDQWQLLEFEFVVYHRFEDIGIVLNHNCKILEIASRGL
ncbi:hypothetical protein EYV94_25745 [Puteibacter caeruleilacunae]|nr:hypothetical protein EYV94_25745 [Puteibacter caeruleilacunae]